MYVGCENIKRKKNKKMNLVVIQGKIVSEIKFDFIFNSKNRAIAIFTVKLTNHSEITVKAYNEVADFCYSKLKQEDTIWIEGYLTTKMQIKIQSICINK